MKDYKKTIIISAIVAILPMLIGISLWNRMPERVATHWGLDNTANGWSSRLFAVYGLPFLLFFIHIFLIFILLNDPKKANISSRLMNLIFWIIPIISWFCCMSIYLTAIGKTVNIGTVANIIIGCIFIMIGDYLPKSKQSYTVGFRLPWTLNSTENWNHTSRIAGKVWILGGIISLLNTYFKSTGLIFILLAMMMLVPTIYSFILFKKGI